MIDRLLVTGLRGQLQSLPHNIISYYNMLSIKSCIELGKNARFLSSYNGYIFPYAEIDIGIHIYFEMSRSENITVHFVSIELESRTVYLISFWSVLVNHAHYCLFYCQLLWRSLFPSSGKLQNRLQQNPKMNEIWILNFETDIWIWNHTKTEKKFPLVYFSQFIKNLLNRVGKFVESLYKIIEVTMEIM